MLKTRHWTNLLAMFIKLMIKMMLRNDLGLAYKLFARVYWWNQSPDCASRKWNVDQDFEDYCRSSLWKSTNSSNNHTDNAECEKNWLTRVITVQTNWSDKKDNIKVKIDPNIKKWFCNKKSIRQNQEWSFLKARAWTKKNVCTNWLYLMQSFSSSHNYFVYIIQNNHLIV